jgi:hypothetical protein
MRTHPFMKVVNDHLFLDAKRKWIQARLEQARPDEQQQFEAASRPAGAEYSNVDGWSYRCCMSAPPDFKLSKIPLTLDGESVEFVVQHEAGGQKRVLLKRRDALTLVLTLNDQPRSVTREEYTSLMEPQGTAVAQGEHGAAMNTLEHDDATSATTQQSL